MPGRTGRWKAASTCGERTRSMRRGSATITFAPGPHPPLHPGGEHRVGVGGVGADDEHDVGLLDRREVLGAGRGAEGVVQAVAGGGVADPRAGVDVVVAERRPHHLLDDVDLLVGAPRRRDAADRTDAVLLAQPEEPGGDPLDGLLPRHDLPLVVDRVTHHRRHLPVAVRGVPVGEAALDARVPLVGAAVLPRHHPHDPGRVTRALHLGLERAADPAVGARRDHRAGRHPERRRPTSR